MMKELADAHKMAAFELFKTESRTIVIENGGDWDEANFTMETQAEAFRQSAHWVLIFVHLAPPCSTFSKARDRSGRTRVRSYDHPEGFNQTPKVVEGNIIARAAIDFARWAHRVLEATVTFENPDRSYMWLFGRFLFGSPSEYRDFRMSYCRYGTSYQKTPDLGCGVRDLNPWPACARRSKANGRAGTSSTRIWASAKAQQQQQQRIPQDFVRSTLPVCLTFWRKSCQLQQKKG